MSRLTREQIEHVRKYPANSNVHEDLLDTIDALEAELTAKVAEANAYWSGLLLGLRSWANSLDCSFPYSGQKKDDPTDCGGNMNHCRKHSILVRLPLAANRKAAEEARGGGK